VRKKRRKNITTTRIKRKRLKKSRKTDVARFKKLRYASFVSNGIVTSDLFDVQRRHNSGNSGIENYIHVLAEVTGGKERNVLEKLEI
jgi:hypothetical protein